jgi:hypothetical protein
MLCLRDVVHSDPRRALELIENGERELHRSRFSDERALLKMHALVHLGRIAAARDEAVKLLRRNPGSPLAGRVYRLTGVHPRPRPGP